MKDKKFVALLGIGGVLIIVAIANYFIQKDSMKPAFSDEEKTADSRTSMSSIADKSMPPNHDQMIEIQKLKDHLKTNPNDTDHWIQLGNLLFDLAQFEESLEPYKTALQQRPENNDVRTDYAVSLFNIGQPQEAIKELERVVQSDAKHVTALFNLGVIHMHTSQIDQAKSYWNRLIEISPNSEMAKKAKQSLTNLK